MKSYLIVVLLCISLAANDIEHLFICLLASCVSSFEEMSTWVLCLFFNWVVIFLLSCRSSLYFLDKSSLSDKWLASIFFPILWVVFSVSWWRPLKHKSLTFWWGPIYLFFLWLLLLLVSYLWNQCQIQIALHIDWALLNHGSKAVNPQPVPPVKCPHGPRQQGMGEGCEQARPPPSVNTSWIILCLWSISRALKWLLHHFCPAF